MYRKCYNKCCKNGALLEAMPKMENCVSTAPVRTNQGSSPPENHTKNKTNSTCDGHPRCDTKIAERRNRYLQPRDRSHDHRNIHLQRHAHTGMEDSRYDNLPEIYARPRWKDINEPLDVARHQENFCSLSNRCLAVCSFAVRSKPCGLTFLRVCVCIASTDAGYIVRAHLMLLHTMIASTADPRLTMRKSAQSTLSIWSIWTGSARQGGPST